MGRGEFILVNYALQTGKKGRAYLWSIFTAATKQSWTLHRGKRDCAECFRVILHAVLLIGLSPRPIENKFTIRMLFEIERHGTYELGAVG